MSKRRKQFIWFDYDYIQCGVVLAISEEEAVSILKKKMIPIGERVNVWGLPKTETGQFYRETGILVVYQSSNVLDCFKKDRWN